MSKIYCDNYMGDSGFHLYVHCMRKGIVTASQCMQCEYRKISDARINAKKEFDLREVRKKNERNKIHDVY